MKKVPITLCISLVLGICTSVQAAGWDDGAAADHNWSSPANWDGNAVPIGNEDAWIVAAQSAAPNNPVVQGGDLIPASGDLGYIVVGNSSTPAGVNPKLGFNGGTVNAKVMIVGWDASSTVTSSVEMADGVVNLNGDSGANHAHFWLGNGSAGAGPAYFTQTGGTVITKVGIFCGPGVSYAEANLLGGEFHVTEGLHLWPAGRCNIDGGTLKLDGSFNPQAGCVVNIASGAFIIDGDVTASIAGWMSSGFIIADNGTSLVVYDYNGTTPGKTTITSSGQTIAHWRFEGGVDGEEHAGDQDDWYPDLSGNGNHLSSWSGTSRPMATTDRPFDPVPLTGEANTLALYYDRSDDLGTFGGPKMLNSASFDNGWTVEATFKLERRHDWQGIVGKDGKPNSANPFQAFCFKTYPDGTLELDYTDNNLDRHIITTGAGYVDLNTWYSVAATYNAATKTARLYVKAEGDADYTEFGSVTDSYGVSFGQENKTWTVGRAMWDDYAANFFDGQIDEVRISSVALDPSEFINSDGDGDSNGMADAWEVQNFGSAGGDPYYDSDSDGVDDFTEYTLGGDPMYDDAAAIYPTAEWHSNGDMTYVYNRRLDATADTLAYDLVYKLDLLDSDWIPSGGIWETNTGTFNAEAEAVTNFIPLSTYGLPQAFVKLKVEDAWKTSVFSQVKNPSPADGDGNATDEGILSWDAASGAVSYNIYLSTNEAAVAAGDTNVLVGTVMGTTFDASALADMYKDYYWWIEPVASDPDAIFIPTGVWSFKQTIPADLGRGHRLFIKRGILSGAVVFPGEFGFVGANASGTNITWATWADSGFNSACTHSGWLDLLTGSVGPTDTTYWRWCEGQTELSDGSGNGSISWQEEAYIGGLGNLAALQAADERNLNDTAWRDAIKSAFDRWKVAYPDALVYTTQNGPSNDGGIDAFQKYAKPDMSFMFTYEFKSGGNLNQMYQSLKDFREHGKKGIGATDYSEPIPYGMYFQCMNLQDRHIGQSEMCLGMFTPIAYGYKAINAFVYARNADEAPGNDIRAELFSSNDDSVRTALFDVTAENNRQILLMSDSLVRLSNEGVWDVNGESSEIPNWSNGNIPNINGISASDDVVISEFSALHEEFDGPSYSNQIYFMVINANAPVDGTPAAHARTITLTIGGGITALESINLTTGLVETLPVTSGTVTFSLDGGRGKLFKFATGAPFVGFYNGE